MFLLICFLYPRELTDFYSVFVGLSLPFLDEAGLYPIILGELGDFRYFIAIYDN